MKTILARVGSVIALTGCFSTGSPTNVSDANGGSMRFPIGANAQTLCRADAPPPQPVGKVDLLFMIDNSNSMADKQAALKAQFPKLMQALTSGQRSPSDPHPFPAVTDLHVGVVTSDMGLPGVDDGIRVEGSDGIPTGIGCSSDGGDDGRLLPRGEEKRAGERKVAG